MEWISIDNEPPTNQSILLLLKCEYFNRFVLFGGILKENVWWFCESKDFLDFDCYEISDGSYDDNITHWAEIIPPKEQT